MPVWVKRIRERGLCVFDIRKAERENREMPRGFHGQWESDKLIKDQSAEGKVGDVAFPRVNVLLVRNVKS